MDPNAPQPEGAGQGAPEGTVPAGGGAPAATLEQPAEGVQPTDAAPQEQPAPAGQDLIAPYLEGVDEAVRDTVAERLQRFQADSDRNANRKIEEQSTALNAYKQFAEDPSQLETPVTLYDNLMQDPKGTVQWVVDQFKTELGVDLKAQLLQEWGATPGETPAPGTPTEDPNDPNRPLSRADLEKFYQEQQQEQQTQVQQNEARQKTEKWLDTATKAAGLELSSEDTVLREAIIRQAATLMPSVRDGEKAIQMAVEAISNRFAPKPKTPSTTPAPRTANGGAPTPPADVDFSDKKQRQAAMLSMLQAAQPGT